MVELPLPPSAANWLLANEPGTLAFDANGNLWVGYFASAKVARVRTSAVGPTCLLPVPAGGQNPCIEEVFSGSVDPTNSAGKTIHTLVVDANDRVWFALSSPVIGESQLGIINATDDSVAPLPLPASGGIAGLAEDPTQGDFVFARFNDRQIGRLQRCLYGYPDMLAIFGAWNAKAGDPTYSEAMDIDHDSKIAYSDFMALVREFPRWC